MKNKRLFPAKKYSAGEYIAAVIGVAAAVGLLMFPKAVSGAVRESIADCLEVVVPSLFSFTALSLWLQKSGIYRVALRFLTYPLSKLLRMDEELCAVFVLSNIGGFPTGMKLLTELVERGRLSRKDAGRMLCCCFGSGPSFIIGIVGLRVFDSVGAGFILFLACFASSLVMAAIVRTRGEIVLEKEEKSGFDLSADCFISSVVGSAKVMFTVCVMIVGFSAVTALLREIGALELMERLFPSEDVLAAALEITRIKGIAPSNAALALCAALLSFGGVCVHLQLAALGRGIPMREFMFSRVIAVAASAVFALPFSRKFAAADIPVLAPQEGVEIFTKNGILSLCVLMMCAILIWDFSKKKS
ncbi:MAG: hypothetical protein ACI4JS_09920 [Oscillospiraceae bacterium]